MTEAATKLPVKAETKSAERQARPDVWRPFENLRREMTRLFDEFEGGGARFPFGRSVLGLQPFSRREATWSIAPVVDVAEREKEYEVTAELPGIDASDVEVKLSNGMLTIKGEKKEEKEEKKKDFYLSERRYGSFQRSFTVPEGVNAAKIEASFRKGVLTVVLPKTTEALKQERKIAVKAS